MKYFKLGMLLSGLVVLGVAVSIFLFAENTASQSTKVLPDTAMQEKISSLEQNLKTMHYKMSAMQNQFASQGQPAGSNDEQAENTAPFEPENEEKQQLSVEEQNRQVTIKAHQVMGDTLEQQHSDLNWTAETNEGLDTLLEDSDFQGTSVQDVNCKQSLCRIEMTHEGTNDFRTFQRRGFDDPAFHGDMFFDYNEESGRTIVYLAKAGHTLPRPQF